MKFKFLNLKTFIYLLLIALSISISCADAASPAKSNKTSYRQNFYREMAKRRSNNKADYPDLSDYEFANFRAVNTTGIAKGRLYRSSSPVNPWGNRNFIADDAARRANIRTFINLGDTDKKLRNYKNFNDTYCSTQKIILLGMNWKYQSAEFKSRLADGISLMAQSQPPFLIHCDLGKDRTGFVCAVIECLMGASYQEIISDYLISFHNYFGVMPNTPDYHFIANNEICPSLAAAFNIKSIKNNLNLKSAAENYLLQIGVKSSDIKTLRRKLGE